MINFNAKYINELLTMLCFIVGNVYTLETPRGLEVLQGTIGS